MTGAGKNWLKLEQLDRQLAAWRTAARAAPPPRKGWIHTIRTGLGMSDAQLAKRLGVHRSRISQLEKGEVDGSVTLRSLQQAAEALGGRVVVGVIMEDSLQDVVVGQADRVAETMLSDVGQTMVLEDQAPDAAYMRREKRHLTDRILRGSWRKLWS